MAIRKFRESFKWLIWLVAIAFVAWLGLELGANILNFNWTRTKPWEEGIVAEIGDYQLTVQEYDQAVQAAISETLAVRGVDALLPEEEEAIRDFVFRSLVDMIRWRKLADRYGIKLEDRTALALVTLFPPPEILQDTTFFQDGRFNYQLYLQVLNDKRFAPLFAAYERRLRTLIPVELMRNLILKVPSVSEYELWKDYTLRQNRYGFAFVNLVYASVKDTPVDLSEGVLKRFYEERREKFKKPARADLYIVRVNKVPLREDSLQAKEVARMAYEDAKANWEGAVKSYSEDPMTKDRGGEIGWFAVDDPRLPPEIRKAVQNANSGDVFGPFEFPTGWSIVKVLERDTATDSLNLAHILITVKTSYRSAQVIRDSLLRFLKEARKTKDFVGLAKKYGFRVDSTGLFSLAEGFIPFVGPERSLINWIKKSKVGSISHPVYRPGHYLVLKIIDKREAGVPPFEEVKEEVRREYVLDFKRKKGREILKEVLSKLESGVPADSVPQMYPEVRITASVVDSADFSTFIRGLVAKELFFSALQKVDTGKWHGPFDYGTGAFLVLKRYEIPASKEEFNKNKARLLSLKMQERAVKFLNAFSAELEDMYPLKDYRGYLY